MLDDFECPCCAAHDWEGLSRRTFRREDAAPTWGRKVRQRVLFELWQPTADRVDVEFVLCRRCGFLCFRPRPTGDDIAAKYQFLDRLAQKRLAKDPLFRLGKPLDDIDVRRSKELATALDPFVSTPHPTTLDFGGRSGALMTELVERDWRCGVVDYTTTTLHGVERLGNTLEDVPLDRRFDVVVASHVLEHIADPREMSTRLASRLTDDGILFIEVPLEILGRAPQLGDPVTHINFFSAESLSAMLRRAGLEILSARHERCTFESGRAGIGARVIGRRARTSLPIDDAASVAEVRSLLVNPPTLPASDGPVTPDLLTADSAGERALET